jgi:ribonuclease P protein component
MERLRRRAEFLAAAAGAKTPTAGFVLQARRRGDAEPARFGFTVSKKVGNAVERNRVRRRLREMVRHAAAGRIEAGHDYVLIGRRMALELPFDRLTEDFFAALALLKLGPGGPSRAGRRDQAGSPAKDGDEHSSC